VHNRQLSQEMQDLRRYVASVVQLVKFENPVSADFDQPNSLLVSVLGLAVVLERCACSWVIGLTRWQGCEDFNTFLFQRRID
jgi:hypothetical protein